MAHTHRRFRSHLMRRWTPSHDANEPVVEPVLFHEGSEYVYRGTPGECAAAAPASLSRGSDESDGEISHCVAKDEQEVGECTIDAVRRVWVEELRFPGLDGRAIRNKWIYVFRDDVPFAEILAEPDPKNEKETQWRVHSDPNPRLEPARRTLQPAQRPWIEVQAGVYRFFLSTVRLSSRAFQYLEQNLGRCCVEEDLRQHVIDAIVYAPCPYDWAEAAHEKFYARAVRDHRTFTSDPELQAANYVHHTLRSWIDHKGDALDVEDELDRKEFDTFRTEFDAYERELRLAADRAGAYLAGWIDSPWHRTVEMAAQDAGGAAAVLTTGHWAFVSRDLMLTEPTRRFANGVVLDEARFPYTHVFFAAGASSSPWKASPPSDSGFKWTKRSASALAALCTNLLPAYFQQRIAARLGLVKAGLAQVHREVFDEYAKILKRLDLAAPAQLRLFLDELRGSVDPKMLRLRQDLWDVAMRQAKRSGEVLDTLRSRLDELGDPDTAAAHRSVWIRSKGWVKGLSVPMDAILSGGVAYLELAALTHSLSMDHEISFSQAASMGKAGSDVGRSFFAIVEVWKHGVLRNQLVSGDPLTQALRRVSRAGAAFAIASGVCEMGTRVGKMREEIGRQDWGAAVGHAVAGLGGAVSAAGGAVVWCTAGGAKLVVGRLVLGALGGAVIGFLGAGLVIVGALLAQLLRKNEYEDYARGCCFGAENDRFQADWCDRKLDRTAPPSTHLRNLRVLLSNLLVSTTGDGQPARSNALVIECGFFEEGDVLEVHLFQTWKLWRPRPGGFGADPLPQRRMHGTLEVRLTESRGAHEWRRGEDDSFVTDRPFVRDEDVGRPPRIEIPLVPKTFWIAGAGRIDANERDLSGANHVGTSTAYIRLRRAGDHLPDVPVGKNGRYLEVETQQVAVAWGHAKASSLDAKQQTGLPGAWGKAVLPKAS